MNAAGAVFLCAGFVYRTLGVYFGRGNSNIKLRRPTGTAVCFGLKKHNGVDWHGEKKKESYSIKFHWYYKRIFVLITQEINDRRVK